MEKYNTVDTYVDSVGLRIECNCKDSRDFVFNNLINFISKKRIVGIEYDKEKSNKYYQITNLYNGNIVLAKICKGYYDNKKNNFDKEYYYINLNFYGIKRYSKKDKVSRLLIRTIAAYLNTYITTTPFYLSEVDICMDMRSKLKNIQVVCIKRAPHTDYYQSGDIDKDGNSIQKNKGTYEIERFTSFKQKKNAMCISYFYDKPLKELSKFGFDIGFDLTRFEIKYNKRYFVKNEYSMSSLRKTLKKYAVLQFKDIKQKEIFNKRFNDAQNSKQRRKVTNNALNDGATLLEPRMDKVGAFLRELDTIKFNSNGGFIYTAQEDYLYSSSKFNRKK